MIQAGNLRKLCSRERILFDGVSFTVAKGEFVYVTGASGAGKSTLLRLLCGLEKPDGGQLMVNNVNIGRSSSGELAQLRRRMGIVLQDLYLLPERTIFDNIALPLEILGRSRDEIGRRVQTSLEFVSLESRSRHYPAELSGGEQQRVAIARALVNDPLILLADEPAAQIDPEQTALILEIFKSANARGTTILMATHDYALLRRQPRRTLYFADQRLVSDLSAQEVATPRRAHGE